MTDFIAAYDAEINAALDEQGKAFTAARDRFAERTHAAEINLIAAMTHRGRLYIAGPTPEPPIKSEEKPPLSDDASGGTEAPTKPETSRDDHDEEQ